jgi:hypothetical protein
MKANSIFIKGLAMAALLTIADAQDGFTNFIRQVQSPSGVQYDVSVAASGERQSALSVEGGGAQFELWTVKSSPLTSYLLATTKVGAYIPLASVLIRSEDSYAAIPRTRADRPFWVDVAVSGLTTDAAAPDAAKRVKFLRHVQSYGAAGTGVNINRSQATLHTQSYITTNTSNQPNGLLTQTYTLNAVPGADRSKVRGEERFSVFCLADTLSPESQLASQYIQIWPVATGQITGIVEGQVIRSKMPSLSVSLMDLYPDSRTYAQVYKGTAQLGVNGTIVPGLGVIKNNTIPTDEVLTLANYDTIFTSDGVWTMELLTSTPFGIDRLAKVTFTLNRSIQVNGNVTTME